MNLLLDIKIVYLSCFSLEVDLVQVIWDLLLEVLRLGLVVDH